MAVAGQVIGDPYIVLQDVPNPTIRSIDLGANSSVDLCGAQLTVVLKKHWPWEQISTSWSPIYSDTQLGTARTQFHDTYNCVRVRVGGGCAGWRITNSLGYPVELWIERQAIAGKTSSYAFQHVKGLAAYRRDVPGAYWWVLENVIAAGVLVEASQLYPNQWKPQGTYNTYYKFNWAMQSDSHAYLDIVDLW